MKVKGGFLVAASFLVLGLYGLIQSLMFGPWESVALPAAVSGVIVIMASVEVVKELRGQNKRESAAGLEPLIRIESREEVRRLAFVVGWTAAFMLCIYLFGFHIAIPVFAFSYLKWRRWSWVIAAIFAAGMLAFVYGVFDFALQTSLFNGIIFG